VDTGIDPEAANIEAAMRKVGRARASVRAIFITHAHSDHAGAVLAFPEAVVYAISPDVDSIRRRRERAGATGETKAVSHGERVDVAGTPVDVFALPGHTKGSAAYLVHGVLFLGDAAHSMRDGTFGTNEMFSEDGPGNTRSVKSLIEQLTPRRAEIRQVAFGHAGPLDGLDALIAWAEGK
jgi:glyoxylase-like metal-dependent hydrolase (beta-lactamase superfamily II)